MRRICLWEEQVLAKIALLKRGSRDFLSAGDSSLSFFWPPPHRKRGIKTFPLPPERERERKKERIGPLIGYFTFTFFPIPKANNFWDLLFSFSFFQVSELAKLSKLQLLQSGIFSNLFWLKSPSWWDLHFPPFSFCCLPFLIDGQKIKPSCWILLTILTNRWSNRVTMVIHTSIKSSFIVFFDEIPVAHENVHKDTLNSERIPNYTGIFLQYLLMKLSFWIYFCNICSTGFSRSKYFPLRVVEKTFLVLPQALSLLGFGIALSKLLRDFWQRNLFLVHRDIFSQLFCIAPSVAKQWVSDAEQRSLNIYWKNAC